MHAINQPCHHHYAGSYGKVSVVLDVHSKAQYALKFTKISDTHGQLLDSGSMSAWTYSNEVQAYKQLQAGAAGGEAQKKGIPLVVSTGEQASHSSSADP
jgi:hypothetical protein